MRGVRRDGLNTQNKFDFKAQSLSSLNQAMQMPSLRLREQHQSTEHKNSHDHHRKIL